MGTVLLSAWIYVIPAIDLTQQDYFLAAIFGGVIGGAGMGLILWHVLPQVERNFWLY